MAFTFDGRRFRGEEIVCLGGVGWRENVAEEDIGSREVMEQERFQAEKLFFGLRAILGGGRSGREKDVRAWEIVVWRIKEAGGEKVLLFYSFTFSMSED